jgi:hypothetical protein
MRPRKAPVVLAALCVGLLVAGVVVYDGGNHRLGGAILAVALLGIGLVVAPVLSSEGRGAEAQAMLGRRADVTGFDRPRDQSGL